MDSIGSSVTNATLEIIRDIEVYLEQSESTVTVEVGVAIGVVLSMCIMACVCCSAKVCIAAEIGDCAVVTCCKSDVNVVTLKDGCDDDDDDSGEPQSEKVVTENAHSALGTEGAYRSDSDSNDEGEGDKVSREAQKRSRRASGM